MSTTLLNRMKAYIDFHTENETRILKGLQFDMFRALYHFLLDGNKEGYFDAPTGFGKTVLMTQIVKVLEGEELYILVPTRPLLTQTQDELSLFCDGVLSGLVYGLKKEFGKKITIFTYATFQKMVNQNKIDPTTIKYLLLDEPHMALSEKRFEAVEKCTNAIKLGFTASAFYSEEKNVNLLLKKCIFHVSIKQAVEEGFLAPFRVIVAETNVDLSEVKMINGEYDKKLLAKAINIQSRNLSALELHKKTIEFKNESTIVHCVNIKHAENVAKLFSQNGYKSKAVHSDMDPDSISEVLKNFKKGLVQILCNVDMVGVGFNAPIASICFNLRPTRSVVVATQRARNLRIDPNNPKKFAYVVDFFDQDQRGQYAICYADIAGATYVLPKKSSQATDPRNYVIKDLPEVTGLKIHTTSKKIFEITNSDFKGSKLPYVEWVRQLKELNIDTLAKYQEETTKHPDWYNWPYDKYKEFPGFSLLFQRRHPLITFEEFSEQVSKLGIFTEREYTVEQPNHPGWPCNPEQTYGVPLFIKSDDNYEYKFIKKVRLLERLELAVHKTNPFNPFYHLEAHVRSEMVMRRAVTEIWNKLKTYGY